MDRHSNGCFRDAKGWRQPVDPLMLDLDGDGLELSSASGEVLFDHDADGIRTGTGWLGADDGILVRDLDGNGAIDTGRELFGVDTRKRNGAFAVDGFDALADLDTNADRHMTAADAAWKELQVWRDLDQDGMAGRGELLTLAELGVSRIATLGSAANDSGGAQAGTRKDVLQLTGLRSTDLKVLTRSGSDLVLDFGGGDSVKLANFYYGDSLAEYKIDGIAFADGVAWDRNAILSAATSLSEANDSVSGSHLAANDIRGLGGHDSITGGGKADRLDGGAGDDTLSGGAGNDALVGGAGNDSLSGGSGDDTYVFAKGFGADTVNQYDTAAVRADVVRFTDLRSTDLTSLTRSGSDLVLAFNSGDSLKLANFHYGDSLPEYKVDAIAFVDGVTWDRQAIVSAAVGLSAANDSVSGSNLAGNQIHGLAGHDSITGGSQADKLDGGAGDDTLSGGGGDDTLTGGAGNDTLSGGAGNDTYMFTLGFGDDILSQYDAAPMRTDTVSFADLRSTDLVAFTRSGSDLTLNFRDGDSLKLANFHYGDNLPEYKIDYIVFADGVTWTRDKILEAAVVLSEGNDSISGTNLTGNDIAGLAGHDSISGGSKADRLDGGAGDDTLNGNAGNDVLIGGAGKDTLSGGTGDDTYVFGRGDGRDTLSDYDTASTDVDVLAFGADVSSEQLWLRRDGSNLELSIIGTEDRVTVNNWYTGDAYRVEQIRAGDGKLLLDAQVNLLVEAMAAFAPPPMGQFTSTASQQSSLGMLIAANWQ